MAADLGGFTDVLLLVGLAAGLVWWYYNKPTPKVEQKTGKKPGEKRRWSSCSFRDTGHQHHLPVGCGRGGGGRETG